MGKGNVWVDLAGEGGVPLFKKFAMFEPAGMLHYSDAAGYHLCAWIYLSENRPRNSAVWLRKHRRGSITVGRKRIGL